MTERRRVTRREPITIEFDSGETIDAQPLPWRQRNDFGDALIQQYVSSITAMTGAVSVDEETGATAGGMLDDKAIDWASLLKMAFPEVPPAFFDPLSIFEMRECLLASLEINGLETLAFTIDPNARSLEALAAEDLQSDGQKTTSTPNSGSPGTPETK